MAKKATAVEAVSVRPVNNMRGVFRIRGIAPYVQNNFGAKERQRMHEAHEAGSRTRKGVKKEPKNFEECYENAKHVSSDGWIGLPAAGFRAALIRACSLVDFKMTIAKMSLFVEADGFDAVDGTPLVKFTKGEPHYVEHAVRNANGQPDLRARPMWDAGWEADLVMRWDGDQFSASDVANLLMRAGLQVGVGEGRPSSKNSAGMGWGMFEVVGGV